MKLRNKKTGEIGDAYWATFREDGTDLCISMHKNGMYEEVHSLAELNEEWEDYKPKEPLIKDEKVRKAVLAWAKALGLQEAYCVSNGYEIYGGIDDYGIQFNGEPFPFADKNKTYTIAELCGEEEE